MGRKKDKRRKKMYEYFTQEREKGMEEFKCKCKKDIIQENKRIRKGSKQGRSTTICKEDNRG